MKDETRKAFLDLYQDLVFAHESNSGKFLDQIRTEIEARCYSRSHQHELDIILKNLKKAGYSTLSDKLQSIIDSLGEPQRN